MLEAAEGPFDLAFIDCDKADYGPVLRRLWPRMARPSLVVADNIETHARELAGFAREVEASPGVVPTSVPVGNGLLLALIPG